MSIIVELRANNLLALYIFRNIKILRARRWLQSISNIIKLRNQTHKKLNTFFIN